MHGTLSYENWNAALAGQPWKWMFEYPLYSDAHIVGEITDGLGPYQLINAVPIFRNTPFERPTLILRAEKYLDSGSTQMEKTQDEHYHGGSEQDEVAALISLCFGIRLRAGGANRVFGKDGDPRGRPMMHGAFDPILPSFAHNPNKGIILKNALEQHSLYDKVNLVASFPSLLATDATALVRAARMYQEAMWIIETTPELSWIMFVSAVEIVAERWRKKNQNTC